MLKKLQNNKQWLAYSFILLMVLPTLVRAEHGIWIAKKGEQQVTIAAIANVTKPNQWPLPRIYQEAFNNSQRVVFQSSHEGVIASFNNKYRGTEFFLADGESLRDRVSEGTWLQLINYYQQHNKEQARLLETFTPMFVYLTLSVEKQQREGRTLQVSQQLFNNAKQQGKSIVSIDWLLQEWGIVQAIKNTDADEFIQAYLTDIEDHRLATDQIIEAIYKGDLKKLNKWYQTTSLPNVPNLKALKEKYATIYANKLDKLIKDGVPTLVYMDVGYILGERGLFTLLEEKGYQISYYQE